MLHPGWRCATGRTAAGISSKARGKVTVNRVLGPPDKQAHLPARLIPLIRRDDLVSKLESRLATKRLSTIVGPGGIGKTAVAIATAERLVDAYPDGVWCVDLGRLSDPALVLSAVGAAVRVTLDPEDPLAGLAAALSRVPLQLRLQLIGA